MRSMSAVNTKFHGSEQYEAVMVGDLASPSFHGKNSPAFFDREAPLDARPLIEDDHQVLASASSEE